MVQLLNNIAAWFFELESKKKNYGKLKVNLNKAIIMNESWYRKDCAG